MMSVRWWRVGLVLMAGAFGVGCGGSEPGETTQPTTTGSLRVSAATTGEDPDPDGYMVRVGSDVRSIGVNASVLFADLSAGDYAVTLEGLNSNCATSNNPRTASVTAGSEAATSFAVECEALRTSETAAQEAGDSLGSALFRIINDLEDVSSLDGFTFEPARALYQEALALDPDNQTAAFGLAIATVFALEDDPDLRAAADAWETWLDAHDLDELNGVGALATPGPMLWRRASLPLDPTGATLRGLVTDGRVIRSLIVAEAGSAHQEFPPTPAEHQALLQTIVEPALEAAIDALHRVDDSAFTFEVTPAMQGENEGEADPLELDRTEVLVLQAALEAALAGLDIATAYRAEPSPWGADGFAQAMEPGSTFATLADDGAVRLADAHQRLGTAVSLLRDALDFLVAESDNQDDDVIKYDPAAPGGGYDDLDDYVGSDDVADARELLDELEGALAGPTVVTVDLGQGEMDLEVDLTEFFLDPIPDLKALLPTYDASGGRFRWTAATFEEWIFPDPTFDGVLPGMGSTAQLKATIELGDLYEEFAPDTIGQDPGQIAFVSRPTASTLADLHLIRADGTERRQLTDFPAPRPGQKREVVASAATWSPARDRLFMATWVDTLTYDHSTLSLVNVDGTGLSRILDYGSEPSWAPDGTRVAFMGLAPGGWDIFVMDADGTNVINITKTAEVTEGNPAWSPTGATIAYDAAGQSLGAAGIYVMNADGTGATLLTDHDMRDMEPAWSPDGTRIAFVRWKDPSGASYDPDIWVMNADGTDMTPVFEPETTEGSPSWSPEGTGIAFNMNRDDITPSISGQYPHIWIINPDGSGLRQVTSGYSNNTAPTWRPE